MRLLVINSGGTAAKSDASIDYVPDMLAILPPKRVVQTIDEDSKVNPFQGRMNVQYHVKKQLTTGFSGNVSLKITVSTLWNLVAEYDKFLSVNAFNDNYDFVVIEPAWVLYDEMSELLFDPTCIFDHFGEVAEYCLATRLKRKTRIFYEVSLEHNELYVLKSRNSLWLIGGICSGMLSKGITSLELNTSLSMNVDVNHVFKVEKIIYQLVALRLGDDTIVYKSWLEEATGFKGGTILRRVGVFKLILRVENFESFIQEVSNQLEQCGRSSWADSKLGSTCEKFANHLREGLYRTQPGLVINQYIGSYATQYSGWGARKLKAWIELVSSCEGGTIYPRGPVAVVIVDEIHFIWMIAWKELITVEGSKMKDHIFWFTELIPLV
ncbi:OLC1v1036571C1 [Oldenlandia corymbosa var. corymbosa]|uniref:OLC1v1036571C1 n=1 Tax=Oldenlandia corymbosa var. corymbosa TaxID=529605 RepID=A0AAV1CWY8_OLDCO|nr:OLC1v1036571C1 [Oldenlandia corymbosa var. corymbosa]